MHPAQKRAILAILALIEQGIAQLKSILVIDDPVHPATKSPDPARPELGVLGDDDDARLEAEMEKARLQMIEEDERAAEQLFRAARSKTFQGQDPLRLFEGEDQ